MKIALKPLVFVAATSHSAPHLGKLGVIQIDQVYFSKIR